MEYKTREEVPNEFQWDLNKMYNSSEEIEKDIEDVNSLTEEISMISKDFRNK